MPFADRMPSIAGWAAADTTVTRGAGPTSTLTESASFCGLRSCATATRTLNECQPSVAAVYESVKVLSPGWNASFWPVGRPPSCVTISAPVAIPVEWTVTSSEIVSPSRTAVGASSRVSAASSRFESESGTASMRTWRASAAATAAPASPSVSSPSLRAITRPPSGAAATAAAMPCSRSVAATGGWGPSLVASAGAVGGNVLAASENATTRQGFTQPLGSLATSPIQRASVARMLASMLAERSAATTTRAGPEPKRGSIRATMAASRASANAAAASRLRITGGSFARWPTRRPSPGVPARSARG